MDVMALLEAMENARVHLLEAIDPLEDEQLLQPNAIGPLSVRDILVLITVWESELSTGLMRLDQGKRPSRLLDALASREKFNRQVLAQNEGRDLDRIFEDLHGVYVQLERWLDQFTEHQLTEPDQYEFLGQRPLWQLIRAAGYGLEEKYADLLETYAALQEAEQHPDDNDDE